MAKRSRDPYWITARFTSKCSRCNCEIKKEQPIFYYPASRTVLCDGDDCGKKESASFNEALFDEAQYNSQY